MIKELERRINLRNGMVYFNPNGRVYTFVFRGVLYTSNHKRKKGYSMDDYRWEETEKGFFFKLSKILSYKKLGYIGEENEDI